MKITSKNDWKSESPTYPFACTWSIHYGPHYALAGWRKHETGEEFVFVYTEHDDEKLVTRYKGRWWVLIVTEYVSSPSDAENTLIGPFPSRKSAAAAMRVI